MYFELQIEIDTHIGVEDHTEFAIFSFEGLLCPLPQACMHTLRLEGFGQTYRIDAVTHDRIEAHLDMHAGELSDETEVGWDKE